MDINILQALDSIPPDIPRDDWYKVLAAIKSELADAGMEIAENWSKAADNYKEADFRSTWNSLNGNGGINIGTLFHFAKQHGYTPEKPEKTEPEKPTHAMVAMNCVNRWSQAAPADPTHPYLVNKGYGIRQEGDFLLIPMQDVDGNIWSLQTISPDGKDKLYAKGGCVKGKYYRIKGKGPIVICEGFATGSTIREATGYTVVIAFDCGNLGRVASIIRERIPAGEIIIAADSHPDATTKKARKVARIINATIAIPSVKSDFNDLFQEEGYAAVKAEIGINRMPATRQMRFKSLAEIRRNLTGPQYLIKPYLERQVTGIMFGESGAYKSFIAIDMGLSVAFGIDYHGHKAHQGPVFYICGEGQNGIARRVEAWLIHHNLTSKNAPFFVSEVPAELIEDAAADELAQIITKTSKSPPALIFIDTLSTNIGIGDESSNPDVSRLLVNVNTHLRDRFGACVKIVHHVGHGDKDRERGAYAIRGNADARILIKQETGNACSMHCMKVKDGTPFDPVGFTAKATEIPGIQDSEGEPVASIILETMPYVSQEDAKKLPAQKQQALAVLVDMYATARENLEADGRDPAGAMVEPKDWYDKMDKLKVTKKGISRQARNGIKNSLIKENVIRQEGAHIFPTSTGDGK